jgi:hypothetical protein
MKLINARVIYKVVGIGQKIDVLTLIQMFAKNGIY